MANKKIQLMWVPFNRIGKVRVLIIRSFLLKLLTIMMFVCMGAVPIFQFSLSNMMKQIQALKAKNVALQGEITALEYVKRNLNQIEEKDRMLRDYFGLQEYKSLQQIIGLGGEHREKIDDLQTAKDQTGIKEKRNKDTKLDQGLQFKMEMVLKRLAGNYDLFQYLVKKQDEIWGETPSIMPVDTGHFRVTSLFGWRNSPFTHLREFHTGVDITAPEGTKVIAPAKAVVVSHGYDVWLGNYVVLNHGKGLKTIYGHMEQISVKSGGKVKKGDPLGLMGNTGLSTSRHLHYMIVHDERVVDPRHYILNLQG